MVTALTYQFQGWLATLMSNPRRRRTVIVASTMIFVLLAQLPNLMNWFAPWGAQRQANRSRALLDQLAKLDRAAKAGEFDAFEHGRRQKEVMEEQKRIAQDADRASTQQWSEMVRLANVVLPVGWLPLGVMAGAEGRILPAILGLLGMTAIGSASLWRAYRTTLGLYTGQSTNTTSRQRRPSCRIVPLSASERRSSASSGGGTAARVIGAGVGHRAGRVSVAGPVARGENDAALAGDHDSDFRLDALERTRGNSRVASTAGCHRRNGARALRRDPVDGQSIRLRPRRVSSVHPVARVAA